MPLQPAGRVPPLAQLGAAGAVTAAVILTTRAAGAPNAAWLARPWGGPATVIIVLGTISFLTVAAALRWLTPYPREVEALRRCARLARQMRSSAVGEHTPDGDHRFTEVVREGHMKMRLEREELLSLQWSPVAALTRPMSSPSVLRTRVRVAIDLGVVLDAVWPRIRWVLPLAQRRAADVRESAVAAYRVLASALLVTAALLLVLALALDAVVLLAPGVGVLLTGLVAVAAARWSLAEACAQRAQLVVLHRLDLVSALGIKTPRDSPGLVRLGGSLTGDENPDYPLAAGQPTVSPELSDSQVTELYEGLAEELTERLTNNISNRVGHQLELIRGRAVSGETDPMTMENIARRTAQAMRGQIQDILDEHITDLKTTLAGELRRTLEETVTGPPLQPFTGFLVVSTARSGGSPASSGGDGTVSVPIGNSLMLDLAVLADRRAADAAPERGSPDGSYIALQPIHIPGDQTAAAVRFEIVVDSPTLTVTPPRFDLVVPETGAVRSIHLGVPGREGRHEAWIQLFQLGRLIEVIVVPIEVGVAAPETG